MPDPQYELSIFNKLTNEQILKLGDFFDENILIEPPNVNELKKIIGDEFTYDDIGRINSSFYNFVRSKSHAKKIFELIDSVELNNDKKKILKEITKKLHDKTDLEKISTSLNMRKVDKRFYNLYLRH